MKKMGIEGVGLKIILPAVAVLVVAYFLARSYPLAFQYGMYGDDKGPLLPYFYLLFSIGLIVWIGSVIQFLIGWQKKKLVANGFYAIFRNPIYDSFILFIIPALSLYYNAWIYLLVSLVMFLAMRMSVKAEYDYLAATYGKEYEEYTKRVLIKFM